MRSSVSIAVMSQKCACERSSNTRLMSSLKSNSETSASDDAKNTCPRMVYFRVAPSASRADATLSTRCTLDAKKTALSSTPARTPIARLCVATTTTTVVNMTKDELFGCMRRSLTERQLNVLIDTMIMTATSAAMGICFTHGPRNTTMMSSSTPAVSDDSRPRPPDFTLMTDWPIMAQPGMPPRNPATMFAIPWPLHSRFLSLGVSVKSSMMDAVIRDSSRPTSAMASE
ncbi:hypothetical protein FQZ97_680510 [compost metagenome]